MSEELWTEVYDIVQEAGIKTIPKKKKCKKAKWLSEEVTNRFKGLDLVDRVPEELWTKVCVAVQEAVTKIIPKKKKRKKAK